MTETTSTYTAAQHYKDRGWKVVPLHHVAAPGTCSCKERENCRSGGKHPIETSWQETGAEGPSEADLVSRFLEGDANVGLATGTPSGFWVLDIDPDHDGYETLADLTTQHGELPTTYTTETGSGGMHFYFALREGETIRSTSNHLGRGLDTRGEGGQVVAPPSVSTKGTYTLVSDAPLAHAPEWMVEALRPPEPVSHEHVAPPADPDAWLSAVMAGWKADLEAVGRQESGWNDGTFKVAVRMAEVAKSDWNELTLDQARSFLLEHAPLQPHPLPQHPLPWTEDDVLDRWKSALKRAQPVDPPAAKSHEDFSSLDFEWEGEELIEVGRAGQPMATARVLVREFYTDADERKLLLHWRGGWYRWNGTNWDEVEHDQLRVELFGILDKCYYVTDKGDRKPFDPTKRKTDDVMAVLPYFIGTDSETDRPAWFEREGLTGDDATRYVATQNGLVNLRTRTIQDNTPNYFNGFALPFEYDPDAQCDRWQTFLDEIFAEDFEQILTLQELFGYFLSGMTHFQKIALLIGPRRSGKGTLTSVLEELMGAGNCASPRMSAFAGQFGLQSFIDKPLAIVHDARFDIRSGARATETLLTISGEDSIGVPRKFRTDWHGRLPTRFLIISNEMPKLEDETATIVSRFITLQTRRSFSGREDVHLRDKLSEELPGIFNWALDGLDRAFERGAITPPKSTEAITHGMRSSASPVYRFLAEECDTSDPEAAEWKSDVWARWSAWCHERGFDPGNRVQFGVNMASVSDTVRSDKQRHKKTGKPTPRYVGLRLRKELEASWEEDGDF